MFNFTVKMHEKAFGGRILLRPAAAAGSAYTVLPIPPAGFRGRNPQG